MSRDRGSLLFSVFSTDAQGNDLEDLTPLVSSFTFKEKEKGVDSAQITANNFTLDNWDSRSPLRWYTGTYLRVSFGYQDTPPIVARLRITKVTGATTLEVTAKAIGESVTRSKRTKTWKNVTRAEIAREIAAIHGLDLIELEEDGVRYDRITQANETDGAFLDRLAYKQGFQLRVGHDGLSFSSRNLKKKPRREFVYHTSGRGDILSITMDRDITKLPGKVVAKSVSKTTGQVVTADVDNSSDSQRDVLKQHVGYLTAENRRELIDVDVEEIKTADADEAEKDAKARFRLAQQRSIRMQLEIIGDPSVRAKDIVILSGLGEKLSGLYYVRSVESSVSSSSGYKATLLVTTDGVNSGSNAGLKRTYREIFESCIQVFFGLIHRSLSSNENRWTLLELITQMETAMGRSSGVTKSDANSAVSRMDYLIMNYRGIGLSEAADVVSNCRAMITAVASSVSSGEEVANGVVNASFEPEEDLEPVLYVTEEKASHLGTVTLQRAKKIEESPESVETKW